MACRAGGQPRIDMIVADTGRTIPFYNQVASLNAAANFTPDGQRIFYSSTASGPAQIYAAGSTAEDLPASRIREKGGNPSEAEGESEESRFAAFCGWAAKRADFPDANAEGVGVERVTNGEGEASNPAWNPDGQHIASRGRAATRAGISIFS